MTDVEYAKNFCRRLTINQAVGLGVMLTLLAGSAVYGPMMSAHNNRIIRMVRADMVPLRNYISKQDRTIQTDNLKMAALQGTVEMLGRRINAENSAAMAAVGQK